ncbi:50S ribosomal protein L21 [Firmicutes bacterium CAG:552]|jgi:large subunit ribosomal protein L21|nr:MAG: 50S ribosomal protein L21 [Firmicutes bacterium CAG:552_39_19]CDB25355.1 50S ribosomal protein L21 [Firmicutes bacterium CAG:552]
MYAVIVTGGKQFKVSEGDELEVEKLDAQVGDKVEIQYILKVDGEGMSTQTGVVTAEVLEHGKGDKIVVFKYKAKKNERRKNGHRQPFTRIRITSIA